MPYTESSPLKLRSVEVGFEVGVARGVDVGGMAVDVTVTIVVVVLVEV